MGSDVYAVFIFNISAGFINGQGDDDDVIVQNLIVFKIVGEGHGHGVVSA